METKRRSPVVRVGKFLLDVAELYVPMAAFVVLFILFLVNIFYRYLLDDPLTWPFEVILVSFVWLALLSATYVRRIGSHVKFTLTYDAMSPRLQTVTRIIVNALIIGAFSIAVPATWDWVSFMAFKGTTNLRIPFSIVYLPTIPFLLLIIAHSIYDIIVDCLHLAHHDEKKDEESPEVRA